MRHVIERRIIGAAALIAISAPFLLPAQSPVADQQQRTIETLLSEVRQLRQALENSSLLTAKVQLALHRLSLQDQRVTRVSAQLEAVRREMAHQKEEIDRATRVLPQIEQRISSESDGERRKALESERLHLKSLANTVLDPQLVARESELSGALQYERSVAQDWSDKLTALERQLSK